MNDEQPTPCDIAYFTDVDAGSMADFAKDWDAALREIARELSIPEHLVRGDSMTGNFSSAIHDHLEWKRRQGLQ